MKRKNIFIKTLFAATLALTLLTSLCSPALAAAFPDVNETHWAYPSIDKVSDMGLMIGRGTPNGVVFDPAGKIMGIEIHETLYRIAEGKYSEKHYDGELGNPFIFDEELNDWVRQENQWYTDSAKWALKCGLTYAQWTESSGDGIPGDFVVSGRYGSILDPLEYYLDPGIEVHDAGYLEFYDTAIATRSDVILMLYYYVTTYLGHDLTVSTDLSGFTDWPTDESKIYTGDYASCLYMAHETELIAAWEWAVGSGIIKGCNNNTLQIGEYDKETGSRRYITRAEYAVILDRFTAYLETLA